jgi:hypothetical protein
LVVNASMALFLYVDRKDGNAPGTLYGQTGQSEQARTELSTAIEMYRDMGMNFWLPETEAALIAVEGKA